MQCPKCQFDSAVGMNFCGKCGTKLERLCPQCDFGNPSEYEFCGKCGYKLSLPLEPTPRGPSFDEKLNKIQKYLPKGLTEKIISQKDRIEGERKLVTVMFCDMAGFTSLSEKMDPEEVYSIIDQVYETLIHKVHDYDGTVNELTGDGIMALFGAPIALEDAPQRAIRSSLAIHREIAKLSDQIKQHRKVIPPLKMRVGLHTGPVVLGTVGNDLRVDFKAVGDTVNLASRMESLAEPGSTYVTEATFRLTEGLFRFEFVGEKEIKGRKEHIKVYRAIAPSTSRTRFDVSTERGLTENLTFLEGKCLSYSRGVVYHPVIDILKANFDIRDEDQDLLIKDKIKNGMNKLGIDDDSTLPYLLELLSVKDTGIDKITISPEERKNLILEALKQIVLKGSEIRPLIMAYENLHWIDNSSEEFLKELLTAISGSRVLLIFTYRPEFVHTFYIEELINSLRDQKIIAKKDNRCHLTKNIQEARIPSTIHDVIMARVDSLIEGAKGLLQTGSVAGREFSHRLINKVTEISKEELLSYLSVLKDSELLYERGIYPQSNYVFKHALTQEVAYSSLLQKKRILLHRKIGKTLEKMNADRLDELCEVLAYHFLQGEDWERAYKYSQDAGLKAYSHSAYDDAQRYFEEALTAIKKLPRQKTRIEREIDLRFYMRSPLVALGRHAEWGEWIRGAEPLAREISDDARLSNVLNYLSSLHWIQGQHRNAIELGEKALNFAEKADHFSYQIATMSHLGIFFFNIGDYPKQIEIHQKVRERLVGEEVFMQHGLASLPGALSRSMLVLGMAELGNFHKIDEIGREALEIVEKVHNTLTLTFVYNFLAMAYLRFGKLELALPLLKKGHDLCRLSEVQSMYSYTVGSLGYAYLLAKEYKHALDVLEEGAKEENLKASFWPCHHLTVLADAYRAAGEISLATETISRALKLSSKREERGFEAWAMLVQAGIYDAADQFEETKQWYSSALQQASNLSMRPLAAHCHKGLVNSYLRLGNKKEAQLENEIANEIYRSLGMNFWIES
ncbi:MAG: adenylate/guanylate cyclase domain-containing protein [Desulfobacterales bacterium]